MGTAQSSDATAETVSFRDVFSTSLETAPAAAAIVTMQKKKNNIYETTNLASFMREFSTLRTRTKLPEALLMKWFELIADCDDYRFLAGLDLKVYKRFLSETRPRLYEELENLIASQMEFIQTRYVAIREQKLVEALSARERLAMERFSKALVIRDRALVYARINTSEMKKMKPKTAG